MPRDTGVFIPKHILIKLSTRAVYGASWAPSPRCSPPTLGVVLGALRLREAVGCCPLRGSEPYLSGSVAVAQRMSGMLAEFGA